MAAIVHCGRQVGSSILSRAAACAWTFVNHPHVQLSHHQDEQLHASAPGTYARSNDPAECLSESIEAWPSMPDFMWMGKGDQRTFRGKVNSILSYSMPYERVPLSELCMHKFPSDARPALQLKRGSYGKVSSTYVLLEMHVL